MVKQSIKLKHDMLYVHSLIGYVMNDTMQIGACLTPLTIAATREQVCLHAQLCLLLCA